MKVKLGKDYYIGAAVTTPLCFLSQFIPSSILELSSIQIINTELLMLSKLSLYILKTVTIIIVTGLTCNVTY